MLDGLEFPLGGKLFRFQFDPDEVIHKCWTWVGPNGCEPPEKDKEQLNRLFVIRFHTEGAALSHEERLSAIRICKIMPVGQGKRGTSDLAIRNQGSLPGMLGYTAREQGLPTAKRQGILRQSFEWSESDTSDLELKAEWEGIKREWGLPRSRQRLEKLIRYLDSMRNNLSAKHPHSIAVKHYGEDLAFVYNELCVGDLADLDPLGRFR